MMNNTETKAVKIIPKQPRFISDILKRPARINEEITVNLNVREIVRCMQYADVYEGDKLLNPLNFDDKKVVEDEKNDFDVEVKDPVVENEETNNDSTQEQVPDTSNDGPVENEPVSGEIDEEIGNLSDLF